MFNFDLRIETRGDSVVIGLDGDIDIMVGRQVRAELDRIEAADPPLIVLDLSRTSFIDSTGMGLIAAAHARAMEAGRRVVVVRPRKGVDQAFDISGLDGIFEMAEDVEQALAMR